MKALSLLVLASAAFGFAGSASAQFAKPDDAIKYRKNALFVMQQHYARIGAMVGGKVPFDAKAAADNAAIAESMAKLPWAAFGEGTDLGDTKAKPEIWKEQAKFKQAADKRSRKQKGRLIEPPFLFGKRLKPVPIIPRSGDATRRSPARQCSASQSRRAC